MKTCRDRSPRDRLLLFINYNYVRLLSLFSIILDEISITANIKLITTDIYYMLLEFAETVPITYNCLTIEITILKLFKTTIQ